MASLCRLQATASRINVLSSFTQLPEKSFVTRHRCLVGMFAVSDRSCYRANLPYQTHGFPRYTVTHHCLDPVLKRHGIVDRTRCHPLMRALSLHVEEKDLTSPFMHNFLGEVDMCLSSEKWTSLKEEFLEQNRFQSQTFEKSAMREIVHSKYYEMGHSLLDFTEAAKIPFSDEVGAMFLSMCVDSGELDHLFRWYKHCHNENHAAVSWLMLPKLIEGFCQSDRWSESLQMLKTLEGFGQPKKRTYHCIISAACRHKNWDTAVELLKKMNEMGFVVLTDTVVELVKALRINSVDNKLFGEACEKSLMDYLDSHRVSRTYPTIAVMKEMELWLKGRPGIKWHTSFTGIQSNGMCKNCKQQLEPLAISDEQFAKLREELLEKVIKGHDIFRKTTPKELEAFIKFVKEGGPYDIIIDGLNVANMNNTPPHRQAQMLFECVVYLAQECGHKCLVIGRQHMTRAKKWNNSFMDGVRDLADCFFTDDISKDDPFMLYATLHSGHKARYVTKDLLRDHKALLDDEMNTAFFRWQKSRQLVPIYIKNGQMKFKRVFHADVVVQSTEDSWHIPYNDGTPRFSYHLPITWFCARRSN